MKYFLYRLIALFTGKNSVNTPIDVISSQLHEMRPLPMGVSEFEIWSERIISGALVEADKDSQKFALCNMLLQLSPTDHMKPDIHFISQLRKVAVNQIADSVRKEIQVKVKARTAEAEAKAKAEEEAIRKVDQSVQETLARIEA